jgi:hypothetical protein
MDGRADRRDMARGYGVFGVFPSLDGTLKVQPPLWFASAGEARDIAVFLADALGGAVAFSREVDPLTGAAKDGEIIGTYGLMAEKPAPLAKAA